MTEIDKNHWFTMEELVQTKIFPITVRSMKTLISKRDTNGITKAVRKIGGKWVTTVNLFQEWLQTTEGDGKYKFPDRIYTKRRGRPPKYYRSGEKSVEEQIQQKDNRYIFLKRVKAKNKYKFDNLDKRVPYENLDTYIVDQPIDILNREGLDKVKKALKQSVRDYKKYQPPKRKKKTFINPTTTIEEILNEDPMICDVFRRIRRVNTVGRSEKKIAKNQMKETAAVKEKEADNFVKTSTSFQETFKKFGKE